MTKQSGNTRTRRGILVGRSVTAPPSGSWAQSEADRAASESCSASGSPAPGSPAEAFEQLYLRHARPLTRQAYLLCGHRRLAGQAVAHAFHVAWDRWPEVARDREPDGWVRAAVYDYALSPWHLLRPRRRPQAHPGPPADRALLDALLALPRHHRSALLLHDGLGRSLAETAAEVQATPASAAARVRRARTALIEDTPELRDAPPGRRRVLLAERLRELVAAQPARTPPAAAARTGAEHAATLRTRAAVGLVAVVAAATACTATVGDRPAPGTEPQQTETYVPHGGGRPLPETAYLPQLRSVNARTQSADGAG